MEYFLTLFSVAVLVQVIWFLFLENGFRKYSISSAVFSEPVSIVIAAKNEEENLELLLEDLLKQDYPEFEVLVIDDNSSDFTSKVVTQFQSKDSRIKLFSSGKSPDNFNSKKWALKIGIENASHENLLFTDADVRVDSDQWVKSMARGFAGGDIVLGVSLYEKSPGFLNKFIRFETYLTAFTYIGLALLGRPYMGVGRNLAWKKSLYDGYLGIERIKGGDDDLHVNRYATAKNTQVVMGEESLTKSYPKTTIKTFLNQKIRHLSVGTNYRSKDLWLLGVFSLSLLISWITGVFLIFEGEFALLVLLGWSARWIILNLSLSKAIDKMGSSFETQYFIFLDFVYPLYYLSTAIGTLWSKKTQWTTNDSFQKKLSRTSS